MGGLGIEPNSGDSQSGALAIALTEKPNAGAPESKKDQVLDYNLLRAGTISSFVQHQTHCTTLSSCEHQQSSIDKLCQFIPAEDLQTIIFCKPILQA